jgi:site-specific DNA-methyltransferase (adenine-specific)/adenine-specific DNA-methyltransferase
MWFNKDKWLNELWCSDNIEVLKKIPDESVDLIYIDPPFYSNKEWQIIWGNGAERRAFEDYWEGGIYNYVEYMSERLREMKRILKKTGVIYVHLDWHAVHYIKVEMDKIFGVDNFLNEIVWHYRTYQGQVSQYFPRKHDTILFYSKGKKYNFNMLKEGDYTKNIDYIRWNKYLVNKCEIRGDNYPKTDSRFDVFIKKWKEKNNNRKPTKNDIIYKLEGLTVDTVWDIKAVDPKDKTERIGYPTQKPEALLERILHASTKEGDIVLDAFCGCGTTIAVAEKLNRKWIAIDVSPIAVKVMTERLTKLEKKLGRELTDFITLGLPNETISQIEDIFGGSKGGHGFQEFIVRQIDGIPPETKVHDFGIDGFTKDGIPIQCKKSKNVDRNVVDNFQSAIRRVKSKKGQIYAISFSRGAVEEAARLKNQDKIEIELIKLKDFLVDKFGDHSRHQ